MQEIEARGFGMEIDVSEGDVRVEINVLDSVETTKSQMRFTSPDSKITEASFNSSVPSNPINSDIGLEEKIN